MTLSARTVAHASQNDGIPGIGSWGRDRELNPGQGIHSPQGYHYPTPATDRQDGVSIDKDCHMSSAAIQRSRYMGTFAHPPRSPYCPRRAVCSSEGSVSHGRIHGRTHRGESCRVRAVPGVRRPHGLRFRVRVMPELRSLPLRRMICSGAPPTNICLRFKRLKSALPLEEGTGDWTEAGYHLCPRHEGRF